MLTASSFWAAAAALAIALWTTRRPQSLLWRLLDRWWTVALLTIASLPPLIIALDMSYAAPRDFMQDIVSGERLWQRQSLYPIPMTGEIRAMLESQPARWSLGSVVPALRRQEQRAQELTVSQHWVQAHPPLMSVLAALPERLLGARLTVLLMNAISLVSLPLAVLWLLEGLGIAASRRQKLALCALLAGWYPVLNLMRLGQSGMLLTALLAYAWRELRAGREISGGVAIGFAAALKLYPALMLGYLLFRARKALAAAVVTLAAFTGLVIALAGVRVIGDYVHTIQFVTTVYRSYQSNYSLLGLLVHTGQRIGVSEGLIHSVYPFIALIIGLAACWVMAHLRTASPGRVTADDAFYGTLTALMPLLSPIAWQHYWTLLAIPVFLIGAWAAERDKLTTTTLFCALLVLLSIPEPVYNEWLPYGLPSLVLIVAALWTAMLAHRPHAEGVETYWRKIAT